MSLLEHRNVRFCVASVIELGLERRQTLHLTHEYVFRDSLNHGSHLHLDQKRKKERKKERKKVRKKERK